MRLSQESIPALSGEDCRFGSLLGAAGGRPTSGMSGKPPFSSLILNESLCSGGGPFVPFMGILQKAPPAPSPFFLIKIRNDRPERQRAKGAMAEIAPDPGNGLMQVGGGDPGADGRVRLDERGKVVANLEQRPILGIESVFIAVGVEGVERAEAAHLPRAVPDGFVEL